jgi:hypothetical protein
LGSNRYVMPRFSQQRNKKASHKVKASLGSPTCQRLPLVRFRTT